MSESISNSTPKTSKIPLVSAVLAAIGASLCCIGPLVLISLGISGAWIGSLTALEPYRPIFIMVTLLFLFLAFRKLYLLPARCSPGDACALPSTQRNQRIIFWVVSVVLLAVLTFPYYGLAFFE